MHPVVLIPVSVPPPTRLPMLLQLYALVGFPGTEIKLLRLIAIGLAPRIADVTRMGIEMFFSELLGHRGVDQAQMVKARPRQSL